MAIDQAAMYREDIRDLTGITVSKQDMFHIVGVIFFVITFQLIMAGRLGVHGPSPPGWLMGLHWVCCGQAMMWLTLSTWLAMHASARATAGMAQMLTRTVRLPIPTPQQLDKARKFANSYESSKMSDMFRLPFVTPAPQDREYGDEETGATGSKQAKKGRKTESKHGTSASGGPRKLPRWYQEGEDAELYGGSDPGIPTTPEHFELYRGLQQEWWAHDIYARISLLYFMSHWTHGASFYIQSHTFTELRAMWVGWACTCVLVTAHYCLLKIDIFSDAAHAKFVKLPVEKVAFLTPLLTCLGMSFDYSIIEPSNGLKAVIYVIAWICYIVHFLFAVRLYEIACPTLQAEKPDIAGQPWWPAEWWLPAAFQHSLFLIAPPKHCEPGQTCLQQEMKAAKNGSGSFVSSRKARDTLPGLFAYKVFRGAALTMIGCWCLIIVGRFFEQLHGERFLFRQEGRHERWPSHMQPWMPPWTRDNSRNEWCHTGGCDRRLSEKQDQEDKIKAVAQKLSSVLASVSDNLDQELAGSGARSQTLPPLRQAIINWPAQVRPAMLACSGGSAVAALTGDATAGVVMRLPQQTQQHADIGDVNPLAVHAPPVQFSLQGLDGSLGGVLGAAWGDTGLILATGSGSIAECAGDAPAFEGGVWHCSKIGITLPSGGSLLKWAAVARDTSTSMLRAAVVFQDDEVVTVLEQAEDRSGSWLPAGEVRLPTRMENLLSFTLVSGARELLISMTDGGVLRWPLGGDAPVVAAAPRATAATSDLIWRGTCGLSGGRLAHLASRSERGTGKAPFRPTELFISSRRA